MTIYEGGITKTGEGSSKKPTEKRAVFGKQAEMAEHKNK